MAALPMDFTVSKIISLLESEASLLGGVRHELREIKNELISMRSFLEDANYTERSSRREGERTWVDSVRSIAYDVEDIIDEFIYCMNRPQGEGKAARFLLQIVFIPKNLWVKHRIATKLQEINNMVKAIPERHRRYGVKHIEGTSSCHEDHKWVRNHGESSLFIGDEEIVGIKDDKELLVEWLTDADQPESTIISVVGMGGSGKTTLVAQAYNSPKVKNHFDCHAWITVSQTYVLEELFKSIIKEFNKATEELMIMGLSNMSYRQLVETLVNFLKQKRYVIVLDDVWNINLWIQIKVALPNGEYGSRVLLTTRKEDIACFSFGVRSHIHHIQPLGKNEAWLLFCKKSFSTHPNKCCSPKLEILAKDIVEKCEGLPLAIVALGGLMSSKTLEWEWRKVCNCLNWELSNNPMLEVVKSILLLSYNDLPYRLKHCFLYCCVFPEDHLIRRKRLIRLWMAEGFVEEIRGLTLEEVAESYLMELIGRNVLQVVRSPSGRPKVCKMHDIMRELALSTVEREKFCVVCDGHEATGEDGGRRLSVQTGDQKIISSISMSRLRSYFVFSTTKIPPSSLYSIPSGFRLLRVLDMEFIPIHKLPDEIGNLFNLRYLNLKGTKVEELPKSIGRLCNLQTLNLYQTKIKELPSGINGMLNLRYLIASHYNLELVDEFNYVNGTHVPSEISKLKNLQVLHCIEVKGDMLIHLKKLTQLTCLGITKVRQVDDMVLCTSIHEMNLLSHLSVKVTNEQEVLQMNALSSPPPHLRRLNLIGKLERVPCWFHSLHTLKSLYLSWSRLREDPLPYIQALPELRRLTLVNAYVGRQLYFRSGFYVLKRLILRNLPQLNEIIIEKGVMPSLQDLWHSKCMELRMLPHGIEYLTNLQQINLVNVSGELIESIRGKESMDSPEVQHIPKINHYFQTSSGWSYESL